jgi:hypothetical protein
VDTAARNTVGTSYYDDAGNEYIYLQGIGSTVIGSAVTFGLSATPYITALTVTTVRGPVAIAMAAVLATQFGWYQIYGIGSALFNGAAVAGACCFSASTGKVDDAVVTGDRIDGMNVAATVGSAVLGAVFLNFPHMNNGG